MSELSPADFAPLDGFPLLGRWTRRTHDLIPSEVLATIRPLVPSAAAALAPEAVWRCEPRLVSDLEMTISADWDALEFVRDRLGALEIPAEERVILSWTHDLAVETRWRTFVRYWDAFCYPSSDDVTVWSPTGDWTLCYRHFQDPVRAHATGYLTCVGADKGAMVAAATPAASCWMPFQLNFRR